jgi:hypothetical protein
MEEKPWEDSDSAGDEDKEWTWEIIIWGAIFGSIAILRECLESS